MEKSSVKTLCDLVRISAEEYGEKTFLKQKKGKEIEEKSFAQFYEDCRKVVGYFSGKEKFHAALLGTTSYNYLVGRLGTVLGGNVAVPLDPQLSPEDLCDLINRADVSVLFYDGKFEKYTDIFKKECADVKTYICLSENADGSEGLTLEKILAESKPGEIAEVSAGTMAEIVYTSGTTGVAKGVMLSHGNYVDNAFCCDNEATTEDSLLTVLPVHHVYCYTCDILLALRYGATVCVNDSLMRIPLNLKLFQPTIMLIVPMIAATIYKQISNAAKAKPEIPLAMIAKSVFGGRLKGIYSGGAYLDPQLIKAYKEMGIPIAQGYGMTECSPRISCITFDEESHGDVGEIVNGCEVKIVESEILVKSPSVMLGYYKNPEETAKTITSDGWLKTGDLGYVENNRIFITGRKKNLIILSNGENVSPEELENKFAMAEIVAEVLVYAEDSVITAEIVPNPEYCANLSQEEIVAQIKSLIDEINKTVSSSKAIHRIRLRKEEFDKTTSKKIRRNQVTKGEII